MNELHKAAHPINPPGRVLVTGGAGFIGSHTVDSLLERGYRVRVLDSLAKPTHLKGKPDYLPREAEFIHGDVTDKETFTRALKGVSYIFHLAAYQDYLTDFSKFFAVNSVGTALLYEIIVEQNLPVEKIVVASSQAVMGEGAYHCRSCDREFLPDIRTQSSLCRKEWEHKCRSCGKIPDWRPSSEKVINPQNQYAIAKYSQEMIALNLGRRYRIPTCALRYSIVQGPRQSFYNAYSGACRLFCTRLYFGAPPAIYEDGNQIRDYVNIEDVVRANLLVLEDDRSDYQVYNVGGGKPYTVLELARIAISEFSRDIQAVIEGKYRFGDTRHIFSDIAKIKRLGWSPRYSPHKSLADYKNWLYKQNGIENILDESQELMESRQVIRASGNNPDNSQVITGKDNLRINRK